MIKTYHRISNKLRDWWSGGFSSTVEVVPFAASWEPSNPKVVEYWSNDISLSTDFENVNPSMPAHFIVIKPIGGELRRRKVLITMERHINERKFLKYFSWRKEHYTLTIGQQVHKMLDGETVEQAFLRVEPTWQLEPWKP